jgi:hypothetical protein
MAAASSSPKITAFLKSSTSFSVAFGATDVGMAKGYNNCTIPLVYCAKNIGRLFTAGPY